MPRISVNHKTNPEAARRSRLSLFSSLLISPCLLLTLLRFSSSQPQRIKIPNTSGSQSTSTQSEAEDSGQHSSREEMMRNLEVKRREAIYKENLERAKESALLGAEICNAFLKQNSLGTAEVKKLGRIEKLAKNIRNDHGGDDDEEALKEPPRSLTEAVNRLARLSENLKNKIEKTPKHVISASVISSANQLLELIRLIRTFGG